jgi:transcriptional regulator with XRE-family HTH domain
VKYGDVAALLERLPALLAAERRARGLNQRVAAAQIGCSQPTLSHLEADGTCRLWTAAAVLRWLDTPPGPALKEAL